MKWTRLAVGLLATGLLAYSLFAVYPFVLPLLLHHPHGWLVMLASDIIQTRTATAEVYPYIVLGVGGAIYLLMVLTSSCVRVRYTVRPILPPGVSRACSRSPHGCGGASASWLASSSG